MKKILFVQNLIPPYRKPLYNRLAEFYDLTVLHSGKPTVKETDSYKEVITPTFHISKFYLQRRVIKQIRSKKYAAIIVMFDVGWLMNSIGVFIKKDVRYLLWGHRYSKNNLSNRLRDFLMLKSDGVILYGDDDIAEMIKRGIDKKKIYIAPNTMFIENAENGSSHQDKHRILFVGRAQKRKRVDLLIQAFAAIIDQIPSGITLDIIGEGEENFLLIQLAKDLKVEDHINFHGAITDENSLKPFFFESIAYVSPGPVGLSVLQSFAYGLPVITFKNCYHGSEFLNITHNWNGYIYEDHEELKNVLIEYCNDTKKSRFLGNNAFSHYQNKRSGTVMLEGFIKAIGE